MKMQLVQRQYDNLTTIPCIVRVAIAMIPIGLFSVGCAIMYMLCSKLIEQGQSLRLLFTGDDRVLFYLCVAFFGNMAGVILKCFDPVERSGIMVYGQAAWSTIFAIFAAAALLVLFYSFKMRETFGKTVLNIDERQ